jgi:hypothetical protein
LKFESRENVSCTLLKINNLSRKTNRMEVEAMPTFHFYKDGEKTDEMQGADEEELKQKVEEHKAK